MSTTPSPRAHSLVLALVKEATGRGMEWHSIADSLDEAGSIEMVYSGDWTGFEPEHVKNLHTIASAIPDESIQHFEELVRTQTEAGTQFLTILDDGYPANLREIYNRPPFITVRGLLDDADNRAVAVVGTRKASGAGVQTARRLAQDLAECGVTVLSGLAAGIDTAAHLGALDVPDGRTVAVLGTGINSVYPAQNAELAALICDRGALVSQFWPDQPPTQYTFPLRNVVMSGMGIGTVVVEASHTSGAKMQARLALEHGKRVFLLESLMRDQEWARRYADRPGAIVVESTSEIVDAVTRLDQIPEQLTLG